MTAFSFPEVVEVEARDGRVIWIKFDDGESGEVDLSHLTGPVFERWDNEKFFQSVHITDSWRTVGWGPDQEASDYIDLCPDTLYMSITGLTLGQYHARRRRMAHQEEL